MMKIGKIILCLAVLIHVCILITDFMQWLYSSLFSLMIYATIIAITVWRIRAFFAKKFKKVTL